MTPENLLSLLLYAMAFGSLAGFIIASVLFSMRGD